MANIVARGPSPSQGRPPSLKSRNIRNAGCAGAGRSGCEGRRARADNGCAAGPLIEEKWNLAPLTRRDAAALSPLGALDLGAKPAFLTPPELPAPKAGAFRPALVQRARRRAG